MINHLRTLLLNVDGSNTPGVDFPGEQFVPEEFRVRVLASPAKTVRNFLFGPGPDRALLNFRLQEYLTCIHSSNLESFVRRLDPRLTYWPFHTGLFEKLSQGATANKLTGGENQNLYFVGPNRATESVNRIYFQWRLEVISGSVVRVTEYSDASSLTTVTDQVYTLSGGLSSLITLGGSELSVCFDAGVGGSWLVEVLAQPERQLCQVVDDLDTGLNSAIRSWLFPEQEPYLYFRDLWERSDFLPERVAGVVLAIGYQLNETPE